MTTAELEVIMQNLHNRLVPIENILPTLAARDDVEQGLDALEARLREDFALKADLAALENARVLHEDLKDDIGLIAEHLAEVMSRLPPRAR